MRAIELMGILCQGDPDFCDLAKYFSYQHCVCIRDSFTRRVYTHMRLGISVIAAPLTTLVGAGIRAE
jgi:hypothetical protein